MTIKQILQQNNSFQNSTVLAGIAGLEHEVESIMVLEATDIERWGVRNQLLLSSFFALQALSAEHSRHFFAQCAQIGISGLVLKLGRLITDIPPYLIDYCNEFNIPLITLPDNIRYETVILSILGPIIHQLSESQERIQKQQGLINELLNTQITNYETLCQNLHYLKIDSSLYYQVVQIHLDLHSDSLSKNSSACTFIFAEIMQQLKIQGLRFASLQMYDRLTLIFNHSADYNALQMKTLFRKIMNSCQHDLQNNSVLFRIGISEIADRFQISQLNHQVLDILMILQLLQKEQFITVYSDLGIYKLFLDRRNLEQFQSILTKAHVELRTHSPELWQTLETFVASGQSYTLTAKKMFLHPKTVKYRIQQIKDQLDLDLEDSEQIFRILLDTRLFRLFDGLEGENS